MTLFRLPGRKKAPEDVPSLVALGEACSRRGDYATAVAWFDLALDRDPRSAPAYAAKGFALKCLGRDAEARACYDAVLSIGAMQDKTRRAAAVHTGTGAESGQALQVPEPADILGADAWSGKGIRYASEGNFARAADCFDRALNESPGDADIWIYRGRALGKLRKFSRALESFDRALAIRPDDADALYYKGVSLALMRRIPDAYACFVKVLQLQPDHKDAAAVVRDIRKVAEEARMKRSPAAGNRERQGRLF